MIFTRLLVIVVVVVAVVLGLGQGGPGPGPALAAEQLVRERGMAADAALAALQAALAPVLDAARTGSARVVAGDAPPGPALAAAADELRAAQPEAMTASRAVRALDAAHLAADPGSAAVEPPATAGDLGSIADQLAATADAADAFAAMRLRAERLTERLASALGAMEAGDLEEARATVSGAQADHGELEAWDLGLLTLPVWLETTGEMLDASDALLAALEADDADAARDAAARVAALDDEAASADRALRIAMAEGGASVTAAPLGRLASVLADVEEARAKVASILQAVRR